jgi:hypothetical protein
MHIAAGRNVSEAWLSATELVGALPKRHGYHLVVSIEDPRSESDIVKGLLDRLYESDDFERFKYPVETVASTIFPKHMASRTSSPAELTEEYRRTYPLIQRFRANRFGTYFGRIAEQAPGGGPDQLNRTIEKLTKRLRFKACYEVDMSRIEDLGIYDDQRDRGGNRCRGFPCLSHISLQIDTDHRVHAVAYYRSHDVVSKAYGNYLGLGRLMGYVADHIGANVGQLTIIAGHAFIAEKLRSAELQQLLEESRAILGISQK